MSTSRISPVFCLPVGAAMCVYGLTPYLLTIAVRISAILLPFAWRRAVKHLVAEISEHLDPPRAPHRKTDDANAILD